MKSNISFIGTTLACAVILAVGPSAHATIASCSGSGSSEVCNLDMGNTTLTALCSGTGVTYTGTATYPVCMESFNDAMTDAKSVFSANSSATYNLTIAAGSYNLSSETSANHTTAKGVFDVSSISPSSSSGGFNFTGAGKGGGGTILITDNSLPTVWGTKVSHIHIGQMFFQRDYPTTTFGSVYNATCGSTAYVDLVIPTGFPAVGSSYVASGNGSIYMGLSGGSMFLRAYDNSTPGNPVPLNDGTANDKFNQQITWGDNTAPLQNPSSEGSNVWRLYFDTATSVPSYYCSYSGNTHIVVAVKSKFDSDAYNFNNIPGGTAGTDVGFNGVQWQDEARGVFRNITYSYVKNSAVVQRGAISGQAWVLSTPAGGPQIGEEGDTAYSILYSTISNYTATNTGDDSIAIFNDGYSSGTATVSNVTISNSFARDVNLFNSCYVAFSGTNTYNGCNLSLFDYPTNYNGCITDTDQIVPPANRVPECSPDYPL